MIEKKRSVGITAFAYLFIIVAVWAILRGLTSPKTLLVGLMLLICGIGIFKRLPWARKLTIWTAALQIFFGLITLTWIIILPKVFKQVASSEGLRPPSGKVISQFQGIMLILLLIAIAIQLGVIYFFTRPKVKEQFK